MTATPIIPKSNSLEDLQAYIAECSSVVRDKDPKSPEKLWNRLLKESFGDTASRVMEYIPCEINSLHVVERMQKYSDVQFFGFISTGMYYTTMRELLNWGWTMEECLTVVDFTHYKAFKCMTPYFLYGQVSTHNQVTTVSHSQRYGTCDRGYWMPPEMAAHYDAIFDNPNASQFEWDRAVTESSPTVLKNFMKSQGIVRKEVWDRGADMLQNRVFTIGGYTNNPNAWPHFVDQRTDSHTQKETREFTQQLQELLKPVG